MAARAEIAATTSSRAGVLQPAQTAGVAPSGHKFQNDGKTILEVQNVNAAARVLTIQVSSLVDGLAVTNRAVSVPGSGGLPSWVGPFPPDTYNRNDGTVDSNMVYLDYPAGNESDLKIQVLRLP